MTLNQKRSRIDAFCRNDAMILQGIHYEIIDTTPVNFGVMEGVGSRDMYVDIRLLFFQIWAPERGRMNK